jgi:hypothetical protein
MEISSRNLILTEFLTFHTEVDNEGNAWLGMGTHRKMVRATQIFLDVIGAGYLSVITG